MNGDVRGMYEWDGDCTGSTDLGCASVRTARPRCKKRKKGGGGAWRKEEEEKEE